MQDATRGNDTQVDFEFLWDEVEAALLSHYCEPDLEAVRVILAAVAAHILPGPPVWIMLVGPPGTLKTELFNAIPGARLIDKLTPSTFVSGQVGKKNAPVGLLHRVGKSAILAYPDFSTVLEMHSDKRGEILAQMRRIYDGRLASDVGHDTGDPPWEGRITFLVATTGIVDIYYSVFQTLGERFVMARWHRPPGEESALEAMNQNIAEARADLKEAVHGLLKTLGSLNSSSPVPVPQIPHEMQERLAALSEFAVRARTHIMRRGSSKDIVYSPEPEAATRLAQQLAQLTRGSALLGGRAEANEEDYRVALRAGLDSIPETKRKVVDGLIAGTALAPKSTTSYALADLAEVGLVADGRLSPLAEDLASKFTRNPMIELKKEDKGFRGVEQPDKQGLPAPGVRSREPESGWSVDADAIPTILGGEEER